MRLEDINKEIKKLRIESKLDEIISKSSFYDELDTEPVFEGFRVLGVTDAMLADLMGKNRTTINQWRTGRINVEKFNLIVLNHILGTLIEAEKKKSNTELSKSFIQYLRGCYNSQFARQSDYPKSEKVKAYEILYKMRNK